MATIYLGLGSNIEAEKNLRFAVRELRRRFDVSKQSSVYLSKAVGFDGNDFLNLVIEAQTELSPDEVVSQLEEIHRLSGRKRDSARFAARELDIDLLLYGQLCIRSRALTLPRDDVVEYGFVLQPLSDLAPDLEHPLTGRTMADHCQELDVARQATKMTDLDL